MALKLKLPPAPWTAFATTDNKSWSFARVTTGALIAATIFWISYIVILTKKIPENLTGLAAVLLALYGTNRAAEAYTQGKGSDPEA